MTPRPTDRLPVVYIAPAPKQGHRQRMDIPRDFRRPSLKDKAQ